MIDISSYLLLIILHMLCIYLFNLCYKNKSKKRLHYLMQGLIIPIYFMYPSLLKKSLIMIFCEKFENNNYTFGDN